jgi:hypothetical protein
LHAPSGSQVLILIRECFVDGASIQHQGSSLRTSIDSSHEALAIKFHLSVIDQQVSIRVKKRFNKLSGSQLKRFSDRG